MLVTREYRIYPTKKQQIQIIKTFGCVRFVYNKMLKFRIDYYQQTGETYSKYDCNFWVNKVLKDEYKWLRDVDKFALTHAVFNMDNAYQRFFNEWAGFPRFKKKNIGTETYTTNFTNNNIVVNYYNNKIKLPKLGYVKAKVHTEITGKIKNATIKRKPSGKFFVSITYEVLDDSLLLSETDKIVGLDLGIKDLVITSDGIKYKNPHTLLKYQSRLKKLQRKLSRQQKGSNNYNKTREKIAICYEKINNIRKDNLHKVSHEVISKNQVIIVETLKSKNLMQNHNLAKSIADAAWYELIRQLEYKARWYGRTLIKIDTFYPSSQLCHACGEKNPITKNLGVREWVCPNCHTKHDRDINAAINILEEGLRIMTKLQYNN